MRLHRLLLPAVLVPGLLAAPTVVLPATAARPVPASVVEVPLETPPGRASLRTTGSTAAPLVLTEPRTTAPFGVVGVTWDPTPTAPALDVQVRTRSAGTWSDWTPLETENEEPTGEEADGARPGTGPLWVGEADGVQARVHVLSGAAPTGLRLALVDPGDSPADDTAAAPARPRATAEAAGAVPAVRPRSAWGADESIRGGSPSYASRVRAVTLHHTASSNGYDQDDVPRLLRGFYAYHVKSNGWSDIGYNFLVDRFGTVWEGRAGGTGRAVIGAHAGGFNTGTVGVSMIGTYESVEPSPAMLEGVAQVAGWKLGAAGVDPEGSTTLTSAGSTRYRSGTPVRLPTVFGHKAVSTTSCPGTLGTAALPGIRARAAALAAGAAPAAPAPQREEGLRVETPDVAPAGSTVDVVVHGAPGRPVQLWFAEGDGTSGATLRREAAFDDAGTYRTSFPGDATQTLFAVSDGVTSPRARTRVGSAEPEAGPPAGPLTVTGPVTAEAGSQALLTVHGPVGSAISVWFRSSDQDAFTRRREGRIGPDGTYTTTYAAAAEQEYFAMSSTLTSPDATTLVGPVPNGLHVTTAEDVPVGSQVPLVVQGTPGAAVEVWFSRAGAPFTRRREGVLAADGTYRTVWTATDAHTAYAVAAGRTSTRVVTAVTGSAPPASPASETAPSVVTMVPADSDAGRPVEVSVSGRPGAPVAVWFKPRGEEVFTLRRTGTFADDGTYRTSYLGNDDQELYATSGTSASPDASAVVRPVLAAPPVARLASTVVLTGRARPGDRVVVEQRRRSGGAVVTRTTTAGSTGAFRLPVRLADESEFRPSAAGRLGTTWAQTRLAPTLTAPARAGRGSRVALTGTARPGAPVEVLVRRQGATAFVVARRLVADASGRFSTTAVLGVSHRAYARADGLASGQRIVQVR